MENPNFYPPQQNWNQPPSPPQKSNTGWIKWLVIGLVALGLIIWLIFSVANMGKKFGHAISDISQNKFSEADSLQDALLQTDYDSVYAMLARNPDQGMKSEIDGLKNNSDSILQMLNNYQNDFNDTVGNANTNAISSLTPVMGFNYFIKTGRALKLKNSLLSYREREFNNLPPFERDSFMLSYITINEMSNAAPGFLKKITAWENINFNQAVMNVNINFRTIKTQVRSFEQEILSHYKKIITTSENSGLLIIGPNGDTLK